MLDSSVANVSQPSQCSFRHVSPETLYEVRMDQTVCAAAICSTNTQRSRSSLRLEHSWTLILSARRPNQYTSVTASQLGGRGKCGDSGMVSGVGGNEEGGV